MDTLKRRQEDEMALVSVPSPKKARNQLVSVSDDRNKQIQESGPPRTSGLQSRIMCLDGHAGGVLSCKFHPDGQTLASAGHDRQLYVWNVYGECENEASLTGPKGTILDLCFSRDGSSIFTASADKTVQMWDTQSFTKLRKFKNHQAVVNSVDTSSDHLMVSCSDDCSIKVYDSRYKKVIHSFKDRYQLLSCCFNRTSDQVIFGGIENTIKIFDLRNEQVMMSMTGHTDSITGLSLSPDGNHVLSNSMDATLGAWDIRPFAPGDRCIKRFYGHSHNYEKNLLRSSWSSNGEWISAGSSDRCVFVWDFATTRILYRLPGHEGSVNEVRFHPHEPIIMSGSSDKKLFLGELEQ